MKATKTKQFTAYVGKSNNISSLLSWSKGERFDQILEVSGPIYRMRGEKFDWAESDWPPIKVKITIKYEYEQGKKK